MSAQPFSGVAAQDLGGQLSDELQAEIEKRRKLQSKQSAPQAPDVFGGQMSAAQMLAPSGGMTGVV